MEKWIYLPKVRPQGSVVPFQSEPLRLQDLSISDKSYSGNDFSRDPNTFGEVVLAALPYGDGQGWGIGSRDATTS
jgi:hypothetical protein